MIPVVDTGFRECFIYLFMCLVDHPLMLSDFLVTFLCPIECSLSYVIVIRFWAKIHGGFAFLPSSHFLVFQDFISVCLIPMGV